MMATPRTSMITCTAVPTQSMQAWCPMHSSVWHKAQKTVSYAPYPEGILMSQAHKHKHTCAHTHKAKQTSWQASEDMLGSWQASLTSPASKMSAVRTTAIKCRPEQAVQQREDDRHTVRLSSALACTLQVLRYYSIIPSKSHCAWTLQALHAPA